jgi:dTDP-L-rhamnose 4-epimerase
MDFAAEAIMAKFLVTGGAGFIGRHLCRELVRTGDQVRVLDSLIDQAHVDGEAAPLPEASDFLIGDVRDPSIVREALHGVDGVFHLAAEVGVGQSMYEIARYVSANDLGTAVLLQEASRRPVRRIVVASSMSVYGEGLYVDAEGRRHESVRRSAADLRDGNWNPCNPAGLPLEPLPTD